MATRWINWQNKDWRNATMWEEFGCLYFGASRGHGDRIVIKHYPVSGEWEVTGDDHYGTPRRENEHMRARIRKLGPEKLVAWVAQEWHPSFLQYIDLPRTVSALLKGEEPTGVRCYAD